MNKQTIKIKGMHCHSCEILIEEGLAQITEIKNAHVDWKKKEAVVYSKLPLDMTAVRNVVEEAGYAIGVDDQKGFFSTEASDYSDTLVAILVLSLIYLVAKNLGFNGFSVGANASSSLGIVFVVGLTAGISSCMALVGGLILGISAKFAEKHPEASPAQKFRPHLSFILGRILSYFLLGGVVGMIGRVFQLSGSVLGMMTIIVGLVMLLVGLQLTELFPVLSNLNISLPSSIAKKLGLSNRDEKEYSHGNSSLLGALTFFLPCGFTQAMMLLAMNTGSFLRGALIMGIFALGTAPGLLGIGGLTSVVAGKTAKKFFKYAGVLVVALAVFNLSNGLSLTGATAYFSTLGANDSGVSTTPTVSTENGFQIVRMTQSANGYSPNSFTIKKGIPVKWIVTSTDQNSCATSLVSQKINVRQSLRSGENTIEFTPTETGTIPFSCSMGMYRGSFKVIDDGSAPVSQNTAPVVSSTNSTPPTEATQPTTSAPSSNLLVLNTTYTLKSDINPKQFDVKVGQAAELVVDVRDDGQGCMSTITIPGLVDDVSYLQKGTPLKLDFTPTKKGKYEITCAMGVPRGTINVI